MWWFNIVSCCSFEGGESSFMYYVHVQGFRCMYFGSCAFPLSSAHTYTHAHDVYSINFHKTWPDESIHQFLWRMHLFARRWWSAIQHACAVVLMVEILKPAINKLLSLFCFIGMNRKQICGRWSEGTQGLEQILKDCVDQLLIGLIIVWTRSKLSPKSFIHFDEFFHSHVFRRSLTLPLRSLSCSDPVPSNCLSTLRCAQTNEWFQWNYSVEMATTGLLYIKITLIGLFEW